MIKIIGKINSKKPIGSKILMMSLLLNKTFKHLTNKIKIKIKVKIKF